MVSALRQIQLFLYRLVFETDHIIRSSILTVLLKNLSSDTERRQKFKMRTQTSEENIEAIDSSSGDDDSDVDEVPKAKKPKVVKF